MKSTVLYKESRQCAPPSKDYVNVELTTEKLTIHRFRISPANLRMSGGSAGSGVKTDVATVADFLEGDLHDVILFVFGRATLDHLTRLARGELDYLERLPDLLKVLLVIFSNNHDSKFHQMNILAKLPIESLSVVAAVSRSFRRLCSSDDLWRFKFNNTKNNELIQLGEEVGFKTLFFMSKLDVQRHLRKVRQSQTFLTECS